MNLYFLLLCESLHSQQYSSLVCCCIASVFAVKNCDNSVLAALAGKADKNISDQALSCCFDVHCQLENGQTVGRFWTALLLIGEVI